VANPDAKPEHDAASAVEAACYSWSAEYIRPVLNVLQQRNFDQAQHLLELARAALPSSGLDTATTEGLSLNLTMLGWQIGWTRADCNWNLQSYAAARAHLEQPARTSSANYQRLRHLLQLRIKADLDKLEALTRPEVDRLLDGLGQGERDSSVWHTLADWAFRHRDLELLERSYVVTLTNPAEYQGQAIWQRINLMHLLLSGKAARRDVAETIETLQVLPQLRDFMLNLWPECETLGLVDHELQKQLDERRRWIETERPAPQPAPRTQSLRTEASTAEQLSTK
jgi:hypothetical protein